METVPALGPGPVPVANKSFSEKSNVLSKLHQKHDKQKNEKKAVWTILIPLPEFVWLVLVYTGFYCFYSIFVFINCLNNLLKTQNNIKKSIYFTSPELRRSDPEIW